jgi:hypothetical protein
VASPGPAGAKHRRASELINHPRALSDLLKDRRLPVRKQVIDIRAGGAGILAMTGGNDL